MKKGFTLIELLIVIIILGVLATLAAPKITEQVQTSRATEAMQFFGVFRRYANDCLSMCAGKIQNCLRASQLGIEIPNNAAFIYQSAGQMPSNPTPIPTPSPSGPLPKNVVTQPSLKGAKVTFRAKREDPPGTYVAAMCMQLTMDAKGDVDKVEFSSDPADNPFSSVVTRTGVENSEIPCNVDLAPMK